MSASILHSEARDARISDIAQAYRRLGYEVVRTPSGADLPDFLNGFRPDLIARKKPDENLVVEVRGNGGTKTPSYWHRLERALKQHPDWKLQLVDPGSLDTVFMQESDASSIERRLSQAEALLQSENATDLAVVLAFAGVEAAMRRIASRSGQSGGQTFVPVLIAALWELGYFDADDVDLLRKTMDRRNAIVHGFSGHPIGDSEIQGLIDLARGLLKQIK